MKRALFILLFIGCGHKPERTVFDSLIGRSEIEISLSDYKLSAVPPEIRVLKGVKRLHLRKDNLGWTVYPSLSALEHGKPQTIKLPEEISELTSLQTLSLSGLGLTSLPDSFGNLENLDSLFLYANNLNISDELPKLGKLKRLRCLGLLGNNLTALDLKRLHELIPGVTINPELQ